MSGICPAHLQADTTNPDSTDPIAVLRPGTGFNGPGIGTGRTVAGARRPGIAKVYPNRSI